jgi:polysaccharide biosynthesis protein PelC
MNLIKFAGVFAVIALLTGCATTRINTQPQATILSHVNWGVAPFVNNTGTPQANARAQAITAGLLRARGIINVNRYSLRRSCRQLLTCLHYQVPYSRIKSWARRARLHYVMFGVVNEWRYKVGLDGEPSVNVTLKLKDMRNGHVVWSAVGSKVGGSRAGLGEVAQSLIRCMLNKLRL